MKIYIEESEYEISDLKKSFGDDESFFTKKKDKYFINHVGYYHKINTSDNLKSSSVVYMLPKVFKLQYDLFERFNLLESEGKSPSIKSQDNLWARKLIVYFYRGLKEYKNRITNSTYFESRNEQESLDLKSSSGKEEYTFMDLYLAFSKFYIKHRNTILFKHIQDVSNQARKPKWEKTIKKSLPIMNQKKQPIYIEIRNRKKVVDVEEDLITIFVSIIHSFDKEFGLEFKIDSIYKIYKGAAFNKLCKNGLVKLRKIKHKYFSDVMKGMYNLCEMYFKKKETALANKKPDYLAVNKYNQVFEDMIDKLLVNNDYEEEDEYGLTLKDLKKNQDGKIIDHVYIDVSLIKNRFNEDKIYFIADSKYYSPEEKNEGEKEIKKAKGKALYKQFTYAKNLTQFNIDIFNRKGGNSDVKIRDKDVSEGYDIIPNFFIYGYLIDKADYKNIGLKLSSINDPEKLIKFHWDDRVFDRDTLFVQHHNINFLYVLKAYTSKNTETINRISDEIKSYLKRSFINFINDENQSGFKFYMIRFLKKEQLTTFVYNDFKKLNGKCYSFELKDKTHILIIGIHIKDLEFKRFLEKIKSIDLNKYEYKFGDNPNKASQKTFFIK